MTSSFSKAKLYYRFVLISMYVGAFELLIRGIVRLAYGGVESLVIMVIQGWIYVLPLFLLIMYPIKNWTSRGFKVLVLIQILYLALVIAPITASHVGYELLLKGTKNYYLPLVFYFWIFSYLVRHIEDFEHKFLTHAMRLGLIFGVYILVEATMLYTHTFTGLLAYLRSMSANMEELSRLEGIRPLGLYDGHHASAIMFAMLAVFCLSYKRKFMKFKPKHLFYFFFFCLFITTSKTYLLGFLVFFVLHTLLSSNFNTFLKAVGAIAILAVAVLVVKPEIFNYLAAHAEGKTKSGHRMIDKFGEIGWYIEHSIVPNGFMPEGFGEKEGIYVDPIYEDGEIQAYKFAYQVGVFGFLAWFYTVFKPILTLNIRRTILNPYSAVIFVCAFGWLHYQKIFPITFFSIVIFSFTMFYERQRQESYLKKHAKKKDIDRATNLVPENT